MTCGSNFSAMLSCWAASGDLRSSLACKESAAALAECLKTTVSTDHIALVPAR